jgi:hypothetical protein
MTVPILRRSNLRQLSPATRLTKLERTAREIDAEIDRIRALRRQYWNGRSRSYHLQSLYAYRQQLVVLAREVGCSDWEPEPILAA